MFQTTKILHRSTTSPSPKIPANQPISPQRLPGRVVDVQGALEMLVQSPCPGFIHFLQTNDLTGRVAPHRFGGWDEVWKNTPEVFFSPNGWLLMILKGLWKHPFGFSHNKVRLYYGLRYFKPWFLRERVGWWAIILQGRDLWRDWQVVLKPVSPETWQGFLWKKTLAKHFGWIFYGTKSTSGNRLVILVPQPNN